MHGPNGAGKTNLLEALYFGCTGRSCRTTNEREVVRFGAAGRAGRGRRRDDRDGEHELSVGFQPGEAKRFKVDGAPVERLLDAPHRPLVSVFLPDRLELVKGPPALRRAHLDQVVARAVAGARGARAAQYAQALAQRNALLARVRAGGLARARWRPGTSSSRATASRCATTAPRAVDAPAPSASPSAAGELGLAGAAELRYRPRSRADDAPRRSPPSSPSASTPTSSAASPATARTATTLALLRDGRELRAYGSQGEQRLGLLALLLAERAVLEDERGAPPLLLLDDVMSELDAGRRERLVERLRRGPGAGDDDRPRPRARRRRGRRRAPARRRAAS